MPKRRAGKHGPLPRQKRHMAALPRECDTTWHRARVGACWKLEPSVNVSQQAIQDSPMLSRRQRATSENAARGAALQPVSSRLVCSLFSVFSVDSFNTWYSTHDMKLTHMHIGRDEFNKAMEKPCFRIQCLSAKRLVMEGHPRLVALVPSLWLKSCLQAEGARGPATGSSDHSQQRTAFNINSKRGHRLLAALIFSYFP